MLWFGSVRDGEPLPHPHDDHESVWDIFVQIWQTTGVFPDEDDSDASQLVIANFDRNVLLGLDDQPVRGSRNVTAVVGRPWTQDGTADYRSQLILKTEARNPFVSRYVTFGTKATQAMASGASRGSPLFTDSRMNTASHFFQVVINDRKLNGGIQLVNSWSGLCVDADQPANQLITDKCDLESGDQLWHFCTIDLKRCWPRDVRQESSY